MLCCTGSCSALCCLLLWMNECTLLLLAWFSSFTHPGAQLEMENDVALAYPGPPPNEHALRVPLLSCMNSLPPKPPRMCFHIACCTSPPYSNPFPLSPTLCALPPPFDPTANATQMLATRLHARPTHSQAAFPPPHPPATPSTPSQTRVGLRFTVA